MPRLQVLLKIGILPAFGLIVLANGCSSPNEKTVGKDVTPDQFKSEGAARAKAYGGSTIPTAKASVSSEASARRKGGSR
jgi:hypothetical protein